MYHRECIGIGKKYTASMLKELTDKPTKKHSVVPAVMQTRTENYTGTWTAPTTVRIQSILRGGGNI